MFKIQSFDTLGPRLGVYLDGTPYDSIGVGNLGGYPKGSGHRSSELEVENTSIGLTLEVDDEQLVELHSIYQYIGKDENPPYTWVTSIPKEVLTKFDRQTSILIRKLKEAISERIPTRIKCPHCNDTHSRKELDKSVKTRPVLGRLQLKDNMTRSRILITIRCPEKGREIEMNSS